MKLLVDDSTHEGQGAVEYTLIVTLIGVFVIAIFAVIGPQLRSMFTDQVDQNTVGEHEASLSSGVY